MLPLEERIRRSFPLADPGDWTETSDATGDYNCAAHAAGVEDANWWPEPEAPEYYWPPGAVRDGSLEAFISGYGALGYSLCSDGELEPGFEKLVVYATSRGSPQHVARQLLDGRWTSKLGNEEDIEHVGPRSLAGSKYGNPALYLRRPRAQPE